MTPVKCIFFGSFLEYSVIILDKLHSDPRFHIQAVITTPPKPAGRKQQLKKTAVQIYAETHHLPCFTPEKLDISTLNLFENWSSKIGHSTKNVQFFVVAGYSKIFPQSWLNYPQVAPINIHFSLLPSYRGAMPAEWAILAGESQTGVTVIKMNSGLDTGDIISQAKIPIQQTCLELSGKDTRESLYHKLYTLGADLCLETLPIYSKWKSTRIDNFHLKIKHSELFLPPQIQPQLSPTPYAHLLNKDDSFIPWDILQSAINGKKLKTPHNLPPLYSLFLIRNSNDYIYLIERSVRALYDWPGVWTIVPTPKGDKRLKIHSAHVEDGKLVLDQVQLESQKTASFNSIRPSIQIS